MYWSLLTARRSTLTAQQESKLLVRENGVSIIFGCQAVGIDDLKLYLESLFSKKKNFSYDYLEHISASGIPESTL